MLTGNLFFCCRVLTRKLSASFALPCFRRTPLCTNDDIAAIMSYARVYSLFAGLVAIGLNVSPNRLFGSHLTGGERCRSPVALCTSARAPTSEYSYSFLLWFVRRGPFRPCPSRYSCGMWRFDAILVCGVLMQKNSRREKRKSLLLLMPCRSPQRVFQYPIMAV